MVVQSFATNPNKLRAVAVCLLVIAMWPAGVRGADAENPSVRSLVYDIRKMVTFLEHRGWTIDKQGIDTLMPDALLSVCACTPATRTAAVVDLEAAVDRLGGPVESAWKRAGRDLSAVSELLSATRSLMVLRAALDAAKTQCPFWIEAHEHFEGRQRDGDLFTLNFDGGGLFTAKREAGRFHAGGGGGGRLGFGRGFGERWHLRMAFEFGGAAMIDQSLSVEEVDLQFFTAIPLTLRRTGITWHGDLEVAPVALGLPWRDNLRYGIRVGGLVGLTYMRIRELLPWAGYGLAVEYVPAQRGFPSTWLLRAGLRFGSAWRPMK